MLSFQSMIVFALLAGAAMFAWNNWRAREHAERLAHETCKRMGLQLLDETVALKKWRITRDDGRWAVLRIFEFEFSRQGSDRWPGELTLLSGRLLGVEFNLVSDTPAVAPPVRPRGTQPPSATPPHEGSGAKIIPFKKPPPPQ